MCDDPHPMPEARVVRDDGAGFLSWPMIVFYIMLALTAVMCEGVCQ